VYLALNAYETVLEIEAYGFESMYLSLAVSVGQIEDLHYLISIFYRSQCIRLW